MKYKVRKLIFALGFCAFLSCNVLAQKFNTHQVKEGETLESVAKTYGVSKQSILQYNKEIKEGQPLRANTILVVPNSLNAANSENKISSSANEISNDKQIEREPIGFTSHKVRKKETIFGITKEYGITEDELKKYNKHLYANPLQKKMELRIPKYKKIEPVINPLDSEDFEKYIVAPKETRWSIANKYSITLDSMLVLNPGLSKTNSYLSEGYELLLPKIAGSTVSNQQTQLFISYTVPAKMNFYRLEQEFGIKSDEIVRLNPEITERGGLKEGMVIRIPEKKLDPGAINTDNYSFYEVKPKQNEFRLTRKFGMTWEELTQLNPDLKQGLKAGMVLKIPKDKIGDLEIRNSLILDKIDLKDSINVDNTPKILFLLPFRLDKLNLSDKENTIKRIESRTSLKWSLGLYSGALIALDSIRSLGVSVDVKTFDNQLDLERTKTILQGENLKSYNAIVGPLDIDSLKEVAVQAAKYDVPVITPVPADSDLSLANVFFSYTDKNILRRQMLDYVKEKRKDENIIIIADANNILTQNSIVAKFPDAKVLSVKEEEKNIGINRDKLQTMLSPKVSNWVFVESENYKLISSVVSILNSFNNAPLDPEMEKDEVDLRMFTTDMNNAFENEVISPTHLSNLRFTYPSVYREVTNNSFSNRYTDKFGDYPDKYAVRGFDITYDLLLKLAYKNNLMDVSRFIGETEYSGNKFNYEKDMTSGYFNQASYIMGYEKMRIKELE